MHRTIALVFVAVFLLAALIVEPASASVGVENTWTQKAPMQQARGNLGVAVVDDKIYAIGGCNATSGWSNEAIVGTNEEYDPVTDTWVYKAPMPTPAQNFPIAAYGNKIYCFTNGTQVYDLATDTWENHTAMPTSREEVQANVLGDKIYLVGGVLISNGYQSYQYLAINEVYDPQTDTWSTKAPLPTPVSGYASAVFNGKLYVFGGNTVDNSSKMHSVDLTQIYDPATDTWSLGNPSPYPTAYYLAGATTGINAPPKIYLFSAYSETSSAQIYDPSFDNWTVGVAQPSFRPFFGLAVVKDLIYAIGGITGRLDILGHETDMPFALNEVFTPFGYGTVHYTPSPTSVPTETPQPTATTTPIANNEQIQTPAVVAVAAAVAVAVGAGLATLIWKRKR